MNSSVKKWIRTVVVNDYNESELDYSIDVLEKFIFIINDSKSVDWNRVFEDMANASDLEKPNHIKYFADIETFLRKLSNIVFPGRLDGPSEPAYKDDKDRTWGLAKIYRQIFNLVPNGIQLKNIDYDRLKGREDYSFYYMTIYEFRNAQSHYSGRDMNNVGDVIKATLITELSLCHKYSKYIEEAYNSKSFSDKIDTKSYADKIVNDYNTFINSGFKYVDTTWTIKSEGNENLTISGLLSYLHQKNVRLLRILGEPGVGKSTALRHLMFLYAEEILSGHSKVIPVYIELSACIDQENYIQFLVGEELGLDDNLVEYIMGTGQITVMLDGYNEVLDSNIKKRVAREIDYLAHKYERMNIIISDRKSRKSDIPVIRDAFQITFFPMTSSQIFEYINAYCKNDNTRQILHERLKSTESYFDDFKTPLKLNSLIRIVDREGCIPDDYIHAYIEDLFARELDEKKDDNIKYFKHFLEALAIDMNKSDVNVFSELKVKKCFTKCKNELGYEKPDTEACLDLMVKMGLLDETEDGLYAFVNQKVEMYFYLEGVMDGMEEILNG